VGANRTIATTWKTQRTLAFAAKVHFWERLVVETILWALHLFLSWHELLVLLVITDFVEDGSDGMEKTVCHVSILWLSCDGKVKDLRAEDGQAECSCWQGTQSIVAIVGIIACVSRSTKTVETSTRSGQDCDGNKSTNEQ
jgi:hypothetical protein